MYWRIPENKGAANIDDDSLYTKISLNELNKRYRVDMYVTEKDGSYYVWIEDPSGMTAFASSGRYEWYYIADEKLCYTTFYNFIPVSSAPVNLALVQMW